MKTTQSTVKFDTTSGNDFCCLYNVQCTLPVRSALVFARFSQSSVVNFYTGFPNAEAVIMVYDFLEPKARRMHYWKGLKNTRTNLSVPRDLKNENRRALMLEQELLITIREIESRIISA